MADYTARLGDRSLFPELNYQAYLNHGAISPPSVPVRDAAVAILDDYARKGVGAFGTWLEQRGRLRGKLAALVGAQPEEVGFTASTTAGVVAIANCVPWKKGDRVVLFEGEFPTNVTPWQQAARTFELEIVWLRAEDFRTDAGMESLRRELARGVRLVATSAVQFQTGLRMPWEAMGAACHAAGAELFVDAIQAVGAVPIDVSDGIDYLVCGSHKWLMGLEGIGFVYVAPAAMDALEPRLAGWLSHEEPLRFLFEGEGHLRYDRLIRKRADWIEYGAPNALGAAALEASVDLIAQVGVEALFAHANGYLDALESALLDRAFTSARHPEARSCILSVRAPTPEGTAAAFERLAEGGIAVTMPDGWLRFAPSWPNSIAEVGLVLDALG
jgi:cysteine desulfurase / selenocysteine lyase